MKYKLGLKESNGLHRIIALKNLPNIGVKAGDLGGFVASEKNLSQEGHCWVSGNAQVLENAKVFENAEVHGNAQVYGNARVSGNARVFENARVFGDACVFGNAQVSGNARVFGNAWVYGDAKVQKSPITIANLKYHITITETHIFIGCEGHTKQHWAKNIRKIGRKNGYNKQEINQVCALLNVLAQ